jgi:hypothetical protein
VFTWRRLYIEGALSAVGADEEEWQRPIPGVAASGARTATAARHEDSSPGQALREALDLAQPKKRLLRSPSPVRADTP